MTTAIETIIQELDAFKPNEESTNVHRLYEICDDIQKLNEDVRKLTMPAIFALMERSLEAELGSPGPLVHQLESISGYRQLLLESLARQPTELTIWMVNRILNSNLSLEDRKSLLSALQEARIHPLSSVEMRESASEFLQHHSEN